MTRRDLLIVAVVFLVVRAGTCVLYGANRTLYYYGMVAEQFSVAEGLWSGHPFRYDRALYDAAMRRAIERDAFVPFEEWDRVVHGSGEYESLPATDVPGYGVVIYATSRLFFDRLTARGALVFQVLCELAGVLALAGAAAIGFGRRVGVLSGLLYSLAYPAIWAMASQPMRDVFLMTTCALLVYAGALLVDGRRARDAARAGAVLVAAAALLWIRPSAYYLFFILPPVAALCSRRAWRPRVAFVLAAWAAAWVFFGLPNRAYNRWQYGDPSTHFVGIWMWEGLGTIPGNRYGIEERDMAIDSWLRARGHDVGYGTPESNRLLVEYAKRIIADDPGYYLATVAERSRRAAYHPLTFKPPRPAPNRDKSTESVLSCAARDPVGLTFILLDVYSVVFFYAGLALALVAFIRRPELRAQIVVLLLPLAYLLAVQIPLHYEPRYTAAVAWVLLPFCAWALVGLWDRLRRRLRPAARPVV